MPPVDAPLDQPLYGAGPLQAVSRFWRKYPVFSGRAGRAEYWWWALASGVVSFGLEGVRFARLGSLDAYFATPLVSWHATSLPALLWTAVTVVPATALGVRRLHDVNRTGWWMLLSAAVFVASLVQTRFIPLGRAALMHPPLLTAGQTAVKTTATVVSLVASVVLLVLTLSAPVAAGRRFDRPPA